DQRQELCSQLVIQTWSLVISAFPLPTLRTEPLADLGPKVDQQGDLRGRGVEIKSGPGTGLNSQPVVKRPRAVVPSTTSDALEIEQLGYVVRVRLSEREADQACPLVWPGTKDMQPVDLLESFVGIASQLGFVARHPFDANHVQVVNCGVAR